MNKYLKYKFISLRIGSSFNEFVIYKQNITVDLSNDGSFIYKENPKNKDININFSYKGFNIASIPFDEGKTVYNCLGDYDTKGLPISVYDEQEGYGSGFCLFMDDDTKLDISFDWPKTEGPTIELDSKSNNIEIELNIVDRKLVATINELENAEEIFDEPSGIYAWWQKGFKYMIVKNVVSDLTMMIFGDQYGNMRRDYDTRAISVRYIKYYDDGTFKFTGNKYYALGADNANKEEWLLLKYSY